MFQKDSENLDRFERLLACIRLLHYNLRWLVDESKVKSFLHVAISGYSVLVAIGKVPFVSLKLPLESFAADERANLAID